MELLGLNIFGLGGEYWKHMVKKSLFIFDAFLISLILEFNDFVSRNDEINGIRRELL